MYKKQKMLKNIIDGDAQFIFLQISILSFHERSIV